MSQEYFEIYISNVARADEDQMSGHLFSMGASGVCENLIFEQTVENFQPRIKETDRLELIAYFSDVQSDFQEELKMKFPSVLINIKKEQDRDWLEEWKKGFAPFSLTEDTWVVPSWCETPKEAGTPIFIDPGMAFGTGTHETTKVCSQLLSEYLKTHEVRSAFDLGTGTGILAILMSQMEVETIGCCDIDPECQRVSQENFANNKITNCQWYGRISDYKGNLDLVVANIIDGVLLTLKDEILRTNPTSLILSGILEEREKFFTSEFISETNFIITQRISLGEWVGLLLEQKKNL